MGYLNQVKYFNNYDIARSCMESQFQWMYLDSINMEGKSL